MSHVHFFDLIYGGRDVILPYQTSQVWPGGWKEQSRFLYELTLTDGVETESEVTFFPHYYLRNWAFELRGMEADEGKVFLTVEKYRCDYPLSEEEYDQRRQNLGELGRFISTWELRDFKESWHRPTLVPRRRKAPLTKRAKTQRRAERTSLGLLMERIVKPNFPLGKPQKFAWKGKKEN